MSFEQIKQQEQQALLPTYGRYPVALVSGKGATAVGEDGKEYIDLGSGIGVNALGYCDEGWVQAVAQQAATLQHTSNLYYQPVQIEFAAALCAASGMSKAFLCNSGAEANECAIKVARKYSHDKYGDGRATIVTLGNSFHGRTVTTLAATGQEHFHQHFFPFTEGFVTVPAGDMQALRDADDGSVCAVMLECIQGEGGVIPLEKEYLQQVRALCTEKDWLLVVDEVQTGAGRTGTFLCIEQADVKPDVVSMAKGLGGGLPVGACLCAASCDAVLTGGTHGSTFGGNPVVCAAGKYMLTRLTDPDLLQQVRQKGEYIRQKLAAMEGVREVRGMGLMIGIVPERITAADAAKACLQQGVLVLTAKTLIRLLPPLNISYQEIDTALAVLQQVLKKG